jgi:hypothetical protein
MWGKQVGGFDSARREISAPYIIRHPDQWAPPAVPKLVFRSEISDPAASPPGSARLRAAHRTAQELHTKLHPQQLAG